MRIHRDGGRDRRRAVIVVSRSLLGFAKLDSVRGACHGNKTSQTFGGSFERPDSRHRASVGEAESEAEVAENYYVPLSERSQRTNTHTHTHTHTHTLCAHLCGSEVKIPGAHIVLSGHPIPQTSFGPDRRSLIPGTSIARPAAHEYDASRTRDNDAPRRSATTVLTHNALSSVPSRLCLCPQNAY